MTILQQITSFKDNEYSLLRGVWNDVQEDWPYYSDQERQLMKRYTLLWMLLCIDIMYYSTMEMEYIWSSKSSAFLCLRTFSTI